MLCQQCGSVRARWWTHSNEAGQCLCLPPGSVRHSVVQQCGMRVHYCGAAGMKECSASAYQCSSARHSIVQQSIGGVQWWARLNKRGRCFCLFGQQCRAWHNCGSNTSAFAQQPAALVIPSSSSVSQSTMVGPLEWRRTLSLPTTQQCWPIFHPAVQRFTMAGPSGARCLCPPSSALQFVVQ